MSGYDIKKYVEIGLSHFWSESYGQIFPTLRRLVKEGLATRREATSSGRRKRHVYTITDPGRRQFETWLREPVAPVNVRNESLLKFFLASRLSAGEAVALVERYRDQQRSLHQIYAESELIFRQALAEDVVPAELAALMDRPDDDSSAAAGADRRQLEMFFLTLRHGVLHCEARLAWCDEALERMRKIA